MFESQMRERAIAQRLKEAELRRIAEMEKESALKRQIKQHTLDRLLPSIMQMLGR